MGQLLKKGDVYVRGATTLLDIALGIATNAAGSVAGKAIGIVGKGSSDGVTKGRDELGVVRRILIGTRSLRRIRRRGGWKRVGQRGPTRLCPITKGCFQELLVK